MAATASTSSSGGAPESAVPANGSAVLDRLTEQITERLTAEVRLENARIMQEGAVGAQVESLLERHISTHACPICYELMAGKAHQPTLLFPCGHTFCATCLRQHLEALNRKTCPYCREEVTSRAPNISLQQVIDGFVERQQLMARGEVLPEMMQGQNAVAAEAQQQQQQRMQPTQSHPSADVLPSAEDEASRYAEQYRAFAMRCRVMANQLSDSRAEGAALREQLRTAEAVRAHLVREEAAAAERLEAQRLELEVIRSQLAEQSEKVEDVERRREDMAQMEGIVSETLSSLEMERQKALLLVRNFAPHVADELQHEFST